MGSGLPQYNIKKGPLAKTLTSSTPSPSCHDQYITDALLAVGVILPLSFHARPFVIDPTF